MSKVFSVGLEEKVLFKPRRLVFGSSFSVEDLVEEKKFSWMEFVEDKLVYCVEL